MTDKTVADDYNALREDLNRLRADVAALASSAVQSGRGQAAAAKQSAVDEARRHIEQLSSRLHDLTEQGRSSIESAERRIAGNPWQTVALVFGLGMLAGTIMRWFRGGGKQAE